MSEEQRSYREREERPQRSWVTRAELMARLRTAKADPGLRSDLASLAGETTEDLGPVG